MMTALEFLKRPTKVEKRMNAALRKVELYKSLTERITVSFGRVTVSRTRDMTANETTVIKLMEAEDKVTELKAEYMALVDETTHLLNLLKEEYGEVILFQKYLKHMSNRDICKFIHLGHSQVTIHHDAAMKELDCMLQRME